MGQEGRCASVASWEKELAPAHDNPGKKKGERYICIVPYTLCGNDNIILVVVNLAVVVVVVLVVIDY